MRTMFRRAAPALLALAVVCSVSWRLSAAPASARTSQDATSALVPMPSKLSDADFWTLVGGLSEPNGFFQSDNYVGNELSFQWVIPELKKSVKPGGVYLGVGPDQNFTYIAALQPKIVFIVDVREGNQLQLLMYKALIELSADRAEFAARLFARAKPTGLAATASANDVLAAVYAQPKDPAIREQTLKAIETHLTKTHGFPMPADQFRRLAAIYDAFYAYGPGITYSNGNNGGRGNQYPTYWDMQVTDDAQGHSDAYMNSDVAFAAIKKLEEANLIVPIIGNFGGPKAIRAVGQWVRERGGVITTFYTSNVEQYLFQDNIWREWYKNVATLPLDSTSRFIRSAFNMGGFGGGGGGGLRSAQLTCSIQELLAAFSAGKINSYYDVIAMSK